jgi:hypothetical protein
MFSRHLQKAGIIQLTSDYQFVYDSITNCCKDVARDVVVTRAEKDRQIMALISDLEDRRVMQVELHVIPVLLFLIWPWVRKLMF